MEDAKKKKKKSAKLITTYSLINHGINISH